MNNAYILERTINDYEGLKSELVDANFKIEKEKGDKNIMVIVEKNRIDDFARIVQKHLNELFNYVDIKFPNDNLTVIVFRDRIVRVDSEQIDKETKQWAVSSGLPEKETAWPTFF